MVSVVLSATVQFIQRKGTQQHHTQILPAQVQRWQWFKVSVSTKSSAELLSVTLLLKNWDKPQSEQDQFRPFVQVPLHTLACVIVVTVCSFFYVLYSPFQFVSFGQQHTHHISHENTSVCYHWLYY